MSFVSNTLMGFHAWCVKCFALVDDSKRRLLVLLFLFLKRFVVCIWYWRVLFPFTTFFPWFRLNLLFPEWLCHSLLGDNPKKRIFSWDNAFTFLTHLCINKIWHCLALNIVFHHTSSACSHIFRTSLFSGVDLMNLSFFLFFHPSPLKFCLPSSCRCPPYFLRNRLFRYCSYSFFHYFPFLM